LKNAGEKDVRLPTTGHCGIGCTLLTDQLLLGKNSARFSQPKVGLEGVPTPSVFQPEYPEVRAKRASNILQSRT
jgi:hypothetical protein